VSPDVLDPAAFAHLLEITGGDLEFVDSLVDTFIADGADQLAAMRQAATVDDPAAIVRPAHSLKSSAANVGAMALVAGCRSLEEDGRAGTVSDMTVRVDACAEAFDEVCAALLADRSAR
jgi:HPt (histidine-containing phosphotransfer) domain-containing protein